MSNLRRFTALCCLMQALAAQGQSETDAVAEAEPEAKGRVLEEVLVTAQKREQSIQDVPISMSAITGDMLVEQGVTDITEALQLVPNASIDAAGFFAAPRVRGFTFNNNNKSFEPPVGIAIDGIPHTRIPYFLAALFDIQRMEVLRGPQGTSFGKNTTAGLVHVISNQPSPDPNGTISLEAGELDRRRLEAAWGGALTDSLNIRVAGLVDEREGFIRNTTADVVPLATENLKARERTGLRAILEWTDLYDSRLVLGVELFELFDGGAALETMQVGPAFTEAMRRYDPGVDIIPGNYTASIDLPDFRDITIKRYRLQWEKELFGGDLVAIAGHAVMDQELSLDTDFTPAEAINGFGGDHSPMSYGELRFVAPSLDGLFGLGDWGSTDILFGVTGSKREILDSDFIFGINNGPFFDLVGAAGTDAGGTGGAETGGLIGAIPGNPVNTDDSYDEFNQSFEQSADALSLYAHTKWQISEVWGVEVGARYTSEEKEGFWDVFFTTPPPNPSLQGVGVEEFTAVRKRKESNLQPKVSFNFQPNDWLSIFVHWEKGFKGGGFNAFAFREGTQDEGFEDDDLVFEDEIAENWGLDIKTTLFDGAAKLNVSFFRQSAEDFQVLIRENPPGTIGLGTSRVVNAEEAISQGIEADLIWLATEWLTLTAGIGYLDTEFVQFADGECAAGSSNSNTDGDENPRCDQSGKEFPFAPKISGAFSFRTQFPIAGTDLLLTAGSLIEYEADQLLDVDLQEKKRQDSYSRYKADIGIKNEAKGWSLRLVGENLTNVATHIRLGDVFENVVVGSQRAPELYYLQFRQEF